MANICSIQTVSCKAIRCYARPYRTNQGYTGPYGAIRDNTELYRTIGGNTGPQRAKWDRAGLYGANGTKWGHSGPYRAIQGHMEPYRPYGAIRMLETFAILHDFSAKKCST